VSRIARRNAGDVTASRGAFMNSDGAGGSPAWLHAALVGRDEDGCAETATSNISAADRDGQTSAKERAMSAPWTKRNGQSLFRSDQRYHDREGASSMVTAGATANTTVKNSRASRESGLLCSHSHRESIP